MMGDSGADAHLPPEPPIFGRESELPRQLGLVQNNQHVYLRASYQGSGARFEMSRNWIENLDGEIRGRSRGEYCEFVDL